MSLTAREAEAPAILVVDADQEAGDRLAAALSILEHPAAATPLDGEPVAAVVAEALDPVDPRRRPNNSHIVKPVDFEQFIEAVRHIGLY